MKQVRRVIIKQNSNDQSYVFEDSHATDIDHLISDVKEAVSINLWSTNEIPFNLSNITDPTKLGLPFLPSKQGTVFRICDIPPDGSYINRLDEILLNGEKISDKQKKLKHPLMHKVDCLSYAVILEGEVTLILDNAETKLKQGDVVIDCGSHHAWSNQTKEICRMVFVLLDAKRK